MLSHQYNSFHMEIKSNFRFPTRVLIIKTDSTTCIVCTVNKIIMN